jgi:Ca2+-dependent lipid-binding protein
MEINGRPYYIRSKGNVPYLYDIDTNDEVGYWSSKKGCYVMFSLYNRMMKQKYDEVSSSTSESESDSSSNSSSEEVKSNSSSQDDGDESDKEEAEEEEEEEEEECCDKTIETQNTSISSKKMNTYSLMFLFLVLFVYLTLQKEFQSIYFDFIFLILINLLNTLKVFEILNEV